MSRNIKDELEENGYIIIENVLNNEEIEIAKELFNNWIVKNPFIKTFHVKNNYNGILKYHEVGHQEHAWYIRTRENVQKCFKEIYNTNELIVSFDGCCWFNKDLKNKKDECWVHCDQAPINKSFECYQGFVSLTNNEKSSLVVYEGSHKLHAEYFKDNDSEKNWILIDKLFLEKIKQTRKVLNVKSGSLVLWDSRTFHENQYNYPNCEERLVQYVCFFPKNHYNNTEEQRKLRKKYFNELRTTTHWPCPINVIKLQPSNETKIDYSKLLKPKLDKYMIDILKLI